MGNYIKRKVYIYSLLSLLMSEAEILPQSVVVTYYFEYNDLEQSEMALLCLSVRSYSNDCCNC